MTSTVTYSFIDYDKEPSKSSINIVTVTGANYDATQTNITNFQNALDAICLGNVTANTQSNKNLFSKDPPADPLAKRELKYQVTSEDVTQWLDAPTNTIPNPNYRELFTNTIPTANPALQAGNSQILFPSANVQGVITAFIAEWESFAKSPSGGTYNVREIKIVGRNL